MQLPALIESWFIKQLKKQTEMQSKGHTGALRCLRLKFRGLHLNIQKTKWVQSAARRVIIHTQVFENVKR